MVRRRGINLADGSGACLYLPTKGVSKRPMSDHDNPMIYHPPSTMTLSGIREMLIITTIPDAAAFHSVLGHCSVFGICLYYAVRPAPHRLAQAYQIGPAFVDDQPSALIRDDNIFCGLGFIDRSARADDRAGGGCRFGYYVINFIVSAVVALDAEGGAETIEEKPAQLRSSYVLTGLCFYDGEAVIRARDLKTLPRGELKILKLNRMYLERGNLAVVLRGRGYVWLDTGTHGSLLDAAIYMRVIDERHGLRICCSEKIAAPLRKSAYDEYLMMLLYQQGARMQFEVRPPIRGEDFSTSASRPHYSVFDRTNRYSAPGGAVPHWWANLRGMMAAIGTER